MVVLWPVFGSVNTISYSRDVSVVGSKLIVE